MRAASCTTFLSPQCLKTTMCVSNLLGCRSWHPVPSILVFPNSNHKNNDFCSQKSTIIFNDQLLLYVTGDRSQVDMVVFHDSTITAPKNCDIRHFLRKKRLYLVVWVDLFEVREAAARKIDIGFFSYWCSLPLVSDSTSRKPAGDSYWTYWYYDAAGWSVYQRSNCWSFLCCLQVLDGLVTITVKRESKIHDWIDWILWIYYTYSYWLLSVDHLRLNSGYVRLYPFTYHLVHMCACCIIWMRVPARMFTTDSSITSPK